MSGTAGGRLGGSEGLQEPRVDGVPARSGFAATPLVHLPEDLGFPAASVRGKAEYRNPTGSFKDRIAARAAVVVARRGLVGVVGTSSGNGGAAVAAWAAQHGCRAVIFARSDVVAIKLAEMRAYGARVYRVDVGRDDGATGLAKAEAVAELATRQRWFPYITAYRFAPEAMEGAETIAVELAEQAPETTAVYVPVGGGGLLTAIHRGYARVAATLPNAGLPRLVGVQPSGCATLPLALRDGVGSLRGKVTTTVSGLQVPMLYDAAGATAAVQDTGGHAVTVSDESIWDVQRLLARRAGVLVEPAGAAALAGAREDARAGRLTAGDHVVVVLSGAGYKDLSALQRLSGQEPVPVIRPDEMSAKLEEATEARS